MPGRIRASRLLALGALSLFAGSFFLPAYGENDDPALGWECLRFCLGILDRQVLQNPGQLYYFGFVATNLLFVIVGVRRVKRTTRSRITLATSVLLLAHVASWLVLNLVNADSAAPFPLRCGYHVWLASFVLLVVAEATAPKTETQA